MKYRTRDHFYYLKARYGIMDTSLQKEEPKTQYYEFKKRSPLSKRKETAEINKREGENK